MMMAELTRGPPDRFETRNAAVTSAAVARRDRVEVDGEGTGAGSEKPKPKVGAGL